MKDRARDRIPACVPWHYRAYLQTRKLYRQSRVRIEEAMAARRAPDGLHEDGESVGRLDDGASVPNPREAINKCWRWWEEDLERAEIRPILEEFQALKAELNGRGLRFTNTAGTFLPRLYHPETERGKLWENTWMIRHAGVAPGQTVLDVGGASTIFSFYLAHRGCRVAVVDNDWSNCGTIYNARDIARRMGWQLQVLDRDVGCRLPFADATFDRVFSICVLEHLHAMVRRLLMREIGRVLKPGGIVGLTFDYDASRPVLLTDRGLRFTYRDKLERDVILPSGLAAYGNADWVDACPADGFMGALFLQKN